MCLVHTTGPCIEAEESMNFSPHDGHWLPAWRPKFTKATLPCTSEYRCDGNSVWDEGEGWSSGQAAAVWSSLGERATRRLGEGPPSDRREKRLIGGKTAGDCHLRGLRFRDGLRSAAWGGTDGNTVRTLPLVDSTSHTPKLSVVLKGIFFPVVVFAL